CTTLSQQTRESGRQNKEILIGVQQELHTVKAENAKLTDEKCKLTRKVESLRSQHDTLHEQARQLKDKNNKLVAEDKQLRTLM
ncbi:4948_t:CDS:2, partial [Funneliformis mosseae]